MTRVMIISPGTTISGLGLVASGKRNIKSGAQYDRYFDLDQVEGDEIELVADGTVYDTLKQMQKLVNETLHQTEKIAQKLKGKNVAETCANIYAFLYNHIQYKKDNPLREQLRTPVRSWRDRKSGIDCDCYSIFISSILSNAHPDVSHCFRMAAYEGDFQHVYVFVPSQSIVIDPVIDRFNYEQPYTKKYDHKISMGKVTMLNGLGSDACENKKPLIDRLRRYVQTEQVLERGLIPTKQFLIANNIQHEAIVDPATEGGAFAVNTAAGVRKVPTIITQQQADQLKAIAISPCACSPTSPGSSTDNTPKQDNKKFPWWWIALGAGAWMLLFSEDQQEVKTGLNGLGKKPKKKIRRKLQTLHI